MTTMYQGFFEGNCPSCGDPFDGPIWNGRCYDCHNSNIPSVYCKHGTYIGDPCGPDYLCGPCEMGDD